MKRTSIVTSILAAALVGGVGLGLRSTLADEQKKDFAADKGPDHLDVSGYPAEIQDSYKVFAAKCSKCHTLARPINTDMTAEAWKMYVKRMANKPDSGISPDQGKTIYRFLKFYQAQKDAKRAGK